MLRLLQALLNHYLFAGTLFLAAGATVGGDMGTSGGSDVSSGGGEVSGGASETAIEGDSSAAAETVDESGSIDPVEDTEAVAQQEQLVTTEDGRMIPAKYKDIFKQHRELQDIYVANRFFKQEFPGGLKEARAIKQTLEKFGGEQGITEVSEESAYLRELDKVFMERDPKLIDQMASADKDATVEMIAHGIEKLKGLDPQRYDHTMGKVVFNTINQSQAIHDAYNTLQQISRDNPAAKQAAEALAEWYNGIREVASKAPEKTVDPAKEKFEKERSEWEAQKAEQESKQRISQVNTQAWQSLKPAMEKVISQELRAAGLNAGTVKAKDADSYNLLLANCMQAIKAEVLADGNFNKNYEAALSEGNVQKALKMINAKHEKVVPTAVAKVCRRFLGLAGKRQASTTNPIQSDRSAKPPAPSAGYKQLAKMPDRWEIDWNKSQHTIVDRKAILKDGTKVTWG